MITLPTEFKPMEVQDFVGPAREIARVIATSAAMCLKTGSPAAHLLLGHSGTGKTALAKFAMQQFNVSPWCLTEVFGSDLTVDRARELSKEMQMTNLFGGFRGFLFDEVDKTTKEGRDRMLEFVGDHKQARKTVIIATSNLDLDEFDALEKSEGAKGRFTGRFQTHQVVGPTAEEALGLAIRWLPENEASQACRLAATGPHGGEVPINVRAFLKDVTTLIQQRC